MKKTDDTIFPHKLKHLLNMHIGTGPRKARKLTAGEENIPQLSPNNTRGSISSTEYFLCTSVILNLFRVSIKDWARERD
jgi:hypothetical protein